MATQTQESVATLPSQLLVELRRDLLYGGDESEPYHQTHSLPSTHPPERRMPTEDYSLSDASSKSLPATVPESNEHQPSRTPVSLENDLILRKPIMKSAPPSMGLTVHHGMSPQDAAKATSYHGMVHPDGDTQPMPSQVYHKERESMLQQVKATASEHTPPISQRELDSEPVAAQSARSMITGTLHTLQPSQSGYVDLVANYRDSSPVHSTQGEESFDELLRDPSSPQTQFQIPERRRAPETPAMAGKKHDRDGELLTSVTTAKTNTTSWGFSQAFGQPQAELMGRSQLFAQTQAVSSSPVLDGPRSDPIHSRPSPNITEQEVPSSPLPFPTSSPALMKEIPLCRMVGEPKARYRTMAEELQSRTNARAVSEQLRTTTTDEDDIFGVDSYQEKLHIRRIKRTMSDQAMISAARVKAPARPGSRRSLKTLSRPSSSGKLCRAFNIVTPAPVRDSADIFLELGQDRDAAETEEDEEDLPARPTHEDDFGEREERLVDDEVEDEQIERNDVDEYDELNQGLRSQADALENCSDDGSVAESIERLQVEMGDHELQEHDSIRRRNSQDSQRNLVHSTPRSTVANSQPTYNSSHSQARHAQQAQHSSLASFVPGSQYVGKTSEEQAYLLSSQRRSQSRVPASQFGEMDPHMAARPLSSPALPGARDTIHNGSLPPLISRQDALQQSKTRSSPVQEIPESDIIDIEQEQARAETSNSARRNEETQDNNIIAPYSTARTHATGSAPSPAKFGLDRPSTKPLGSQQSQIVEMSPRRAAGVRRFADMTTGLTQSNGSFEAADVDDVMNAVMTEEDRKVAGSEARSIDLPRPKRMRFTRKISLECQVSSQIRGEEDFISTGRDGSIGTSNIRRSSRLPVSECSNQVLKDSPSKGNELANASVENNKSQHGLLDDTQAREQQGSDTVSQLIAARCMIPKKVPSTLNGRKSKKKGANHAKQGSSQRIAVAQSSEVVKPKDIDAQALELSDLKGGVCTVQDVSSVATKVTEMSTDIDTAETALTHQSESPDSIVDQRNDTGTGNSNACQDPIVAPERIFALFKGTYNNLYPATWLGGTADGMLHKVRFDDSTVTNIEKSHVSSLDLRVGDVVKIDAAGMKKNTWCIVGFSSPVQTAEEREAGIDIRGHARLRVKAKTNRKGTSKDAVSVTAQDEGEVEEVAIGQVYLTKTMWPSLRSRLFKPPSRVRHNLDRATTPSSRCGTPAAETPASRSRRSNVPSATIDTLEPAISHLRDASVASSKSVNAAAIFSGMAFAISYITSEELKAGITRSICRNGGIILDEGFEELFELSNVEDTVDLFCKDKDSKKRDVDQERRGLCLKEEYQHLTFVALIADRHSRRAKYMQALALGLPTLSGRWIKDSLDVTKNASLADGDVIPLSWEKYLLPAGESSYLGGAVRSRTLTPYSAKSSTLLSTISNRSVLLNGGYVVIVAPKKGKASWDKRKTYAFLTLALGADQVKRVHDLHEAKRMVDEDDSEVTKWVYVDGDVSEACTTLFRKAPAGRKRKRESDVIVKDSGIMSGTNGSVKVVNDEFVVQSLILGALIE